MNSQPGMTRVTTRTLVLLFIAFLALAAGAFNLRDRLTQKPVYTDGVLWRDVDGLDVVFNGAESGASSDTPSSPRSYVVADKVEPGGPAALAGVYRGDVLLGISENGVDFDDITRAEHVQIHLDQVKYQPGFPDSVDLHYYVARRNDNGDAVIKDGVADL
ncbi:MAG TPA: PDZ domain-containing protein, partial [Blastocatellia bacterium]|nr:PDZ domain-containing protein [Blastocatellia bacterium]